MDGAAWTSRGGGRRRVRGTVGLGRIERIEGEHGRGGDQRIAQRVKRIGRWIVVVAHAEIVRLAVRLGLEFGRLDAVGGEEGLGVGEVGRDAGGGDGFALVDAGSDGEVQVEELLEEVLLGGEAVGGQHGGVEFGVGVFERIVAGEFECATILCAGNEK